MAATAPDGDTEALTFLFTDIVGSTALWERGPDGMSQSLRIHDEIVRSCIESRGGRVFGNPGDSFCAVFSTDERALDAARTIQSGLGSADWGSGPTITIRIGLHRGEAERRGENLFGPNVNLCARVCDAGHGGQILLTEWVAALPVGVTSCGVHRLRGVSSVVRLLQLGEGRFPPLRTLEGTASNIPGLSLLGMTVTRPPQQTEVQSIADKVDELMNTLLRTLRAQLWAAASGRSRPHR